MHTALVIIQVLVSIGLIGLILLQQGKGADAGAAFGSGSSGTVFGARGAANFLSRTTAILAVVFFLVSLSLAYLVHGEKSGGSVTDMPAPTTVVPAAPAAPEVPGGKLDELPTDAPKPAPEVPE